MPTLDEGATDEFVRIICMGHSGTGKTGALTSLVEAGYRLHILDMDNGLPILAKFIRHNNGDKAAELLKRVDYVSFRDTHRSTPAGPILAKATAFQKAMSALNKWPEDESNPSEWGKDDILVIDSFTSLGRAAFNLAKFTAPGIKDGRQWYSSAQDMLEAVVAQLTSDDFKTNVILNCHVEMVETQDGVSKGFPSAIGKSFSPKIVRYFNNLILFETTGSGSAVKRRIHTVPTSVIDLKNTAPFKLGSTLPISDGLAQVFKTLKEG